MAEVKRAAPPPLDDERPFKKRAAASATPPLQTAPETPAEAPSASSSPERVPRQGGGGDGNGYEQSEDGFSGATMLQPRSGDAFHQKPPPRGAAPTSTGHAAPPPLLTWVAAQATLSGVGNPAPGPAAEAEPAPRSAGPRPRSSSPAAEEPLLASTSQGAPAPAAAAAPPPRESRDDRRARKKKEMDERFAGVYQRHQLERAADKKELCVLSDLIEKMGGKMVSLESELERVKTVVMFPVALRVLLDQAYDTFCIKVKLQRREVRKVHTASETALAKLEAYPELELLPHDLHLMCASADGTLRKRFNASAHGKGLTLADVRAAIDDMGPANSNYAYMSEIYDFETRYGHATLGAQAAPS